MSEIVVGIDLGTTFSLIGVMNKGKPTLIPDADGSVLFPSAVFVDPDGAVHTGAAALQRRRTQPAGGVVQFKRDMGTDKQLLAGGRGYRAEELSAFVLQALKHQAEDWLGCPVERAVISVPAYFGEAQRQATRRAAEIAGLQVLRLVNEPTAAAIAHGLGLIDREMKIAVLDLGGGTFDVTMLEICEGVIEIRSSSGDVRLGGLDFDQALADLVKSRRSADGARWSEADNAQLVLACEQAKKEICATGRGSVRCLGPGGVDLAEEIDAEAADLAWAALAERLSRPVLQAIRDSGWDPGDIDEVLLVGGSSRLPLLGRMALARFGKFPQTDRRPDEVVALGCVMTAGLMADDQSLQELIVTDIAPFTMGIRTVQQDNGVYFGNIYSPIIERGTVIPCSRSGVYSPFKAGQTMIELEIFQGEYPTCDQNTRLGTLTVNGIPPESGRNAVEIRFTYDLNGLLEVEATILESGKRVSTIIEKSPGGMSAVEMERARKAMELLKVKPRDERRNAAVLARARTVYAALLGAERERLQERIVGFELALESQDQAAIQRAREDLVEAIDELG